MSASQAGTTSATPPRQVSRVDAVDLARGMALIGMMLVHIGPRWLDDTPPAGEIVAGGRAAPLFAMLAGVALTLVHRRQPHRAGSVRATCLRAACLIFFGLWLGSLGDMPILIILAFYGVLIVAALPFRRPCTRALLVLAAVWAVVAPLGLLVLQKQHPPVVTDQAQLSDLGHPVSLVMELLFWGSYPAAVWFAYILVGLAVGRLDLRSASVGWRLVLIGAALLATTLAIGWAAISGGALGELGRGGWTVLFQPSTYPFEIPTWGDLLVVGQHTSRPLNVVSAIGSSLLVIGLSCLAVRISWARVALSPLRAAGAMTLTLYSVHVLWTWRYYVTSAGFDNGTVAPGGYGYWLLQVIVLGAAALVWTRLVGRGPLESVVRELSVWGRKAQA